MRWPWTKTETRSTSGGYSDLILAGLQQQAEGLQTVPTGLAAVEQAAGLWSRAFASAEVKGGMVAITPEVLGIIGRELVRHGESLWRIDVAEGRIRLHPAAPHTTILGSGSADHNEWMYTLHEHGPANSETWTVPGSAVLHFRYAIDPGRPFRGIAPWAFASTSSTLATNLESRLGQEAGSPVGQILAVPADGGDGGDQDPLAALKIDIAKARGNPLLVETTSSGWAEGRGAAPQTDWISRRFGAAPPAVLAELRSMSAVDVLAACGVPPSLTAANADGTGQREAFRRFVALTVRPAARLVEHELSEKLEHEIRLDFSDLRSDDLTGRARAFQSLVGGGMAVDKAAALSGLMAMDE